MSQATESATDPAALLWTERPALKEWAAVVRALRTGDQHILLRKGGIHERGFDVRHPRFFLFPTYLHQAAEKLRPELRHLFEETDAEGPGQDAVVVDTVAEVVESFPVTDRELLPALAARTVMTADELEARYAWKPEQALHVLVVRSWSIPPRTLDVLPAYGGCRSWIRFQPELTGQDAMTANHPEAVVEEELRALREILEA